jgi:hypothetical protein
MKKKYKTKWSKIGINKIQRESIYSKLRSKAKTILKRRYKKEYLLILKKLIKRELKGGNN